MFNLKRFIALSFLTLLVRFGYGRSAETTVWFFLNNTHQLSQKFDLLTDIQLRSADQFDYFQTLLLRGALNYNVNKHHAVALGYAYKGDWEHDAGNQIFPHENRIYEQYLYNFSAGRIELNLRARLEQRFVEEDDIAHFSQRLRAFISLQIPLVTDSNFTKGIFSSVQNEAFFNVLNKENVNKSAFDQNRSFLSLGYSFSKKLDMEIGYMYWFKKDQEQNTKTNVLQLMLTTKI